MVFLLLLSFIACIAGNGTGSLGQGALTTVMGILLTGAQLIENGRRFKNVIRFMDVLDEGEVKPAYTHLDDRLLGEYLGFRLLIVGTLIWAFGDLPSVLWPTAIK